VFWRLARVMDLPLVFKFWTYGLNFADIPEGLDLTAGDRPDPEDLCRFLVRGSAVPFDELLAHPEGVRPDLGIARVEAAPTNDGRLELMPKDVAAELAAVLCEPQASEAYPLRLVSRRTLHTLNGAFRNSDGARRRYPINWAWMNPQDMLEAGIAEKDLVEIASPHGAIRTRARAEDRLRRGVVSIAHMFGPLVGSGDPDADGGANVGQLCSLSEGLAAINFMPRFSGVPIRVTALD